MSSTRNSLLYIIHISEPYKVGCIFPIKILEWFKSGNDIYRLLEQGGEAFQYEVYSLGIKFGGNYYVK